MDFRRKTKDIPVIGEDHCGRRSWCNAVEMGEYPFESDPCYHDGEEILRLYHVTKQKANMCTGCNDKNEICIQCKASKDTRMFINLHYSASKMQHLSFHICDALIFVFDVSNEKSFLQLKLHWIPLANNTVTTPVPSILIGCKADLESKVSAQDIHQLATAYELTYIEVSVTKGQNFMHPINYLYDRLLNPKKEKIIKTKHKVPLLPNLNALRRRSPTSSRKGSQSSRLYKQALKSPPGKNDGSKSARESPRNRSGSSPRAYKKSTSRGEIKRPRSGTQVQPLRRRAGSMIILRRKGSQQL